MKDDYYFMKEAIKEAEVSFNEGGIPIGAVLVMNGEIIGKGHNKMIQDDSTILHGEMDAINDAGRINFKEYKQSTLYTTLSPCPMCSGAIILYNIPRVVIGENKTLKGAEDLLKYNNIKVEVLNIKELEDLFKKFVKKNPTIWKKELERVANKTTCF